VEAGDLEIRKRFEQVVLPHLDALYTAAIHLTGDKSRAGDLCERAMLRAYRSFPGSSAVTNCRAWLLTILFGVFRAGAPSRAPTAATSQPLPGRVEQQRRGCRNPLEAESLWSGKSGGPGVQDLFQDLPHDYRVALLLVDVEELSYQDAAKVLEVPVETIRARVSRGRALIGCALRPCAPREP
jgi:RNA polymerase sigma-70 factor (ECF subfamily)